MFAAISNVCIGVIVAALISLAISNREWVRLRLPVFFLCLLTISVTYFQPAQVTDVFVAAIDLGEYGGTFVAFFLLIQLTFVLAYIQLGTTHLPILDTIICVIPSAAFAFYGVLSSPSSAYSSVPAIIVGFVIVLYFWALKPQRIDAKTKLIFLTVLAAFYGLTVVIVFLSPVHAPIYTGPLVIFVLGVTLISGLLVVILQYPRT